MSFRALSATASSGVPNAPQLHVLIVDDDASFAQTCVTILCHDGYAVSVADSARAAMDRLEMGQPRAMLLDWRLPDGTALDVLRWTAARHSTPIPTALVTGFWIDPEFERTEIEAKRLGVRECIRRGLDFEEPCEIVRRLLDPLLMLHRAVMSGDVSARDALARELPLRVVARLRRRYPQSDDDLITGAALDAIAGYLRTPSSFDSRRHMPLERFVYLQARRLVCNVFRSERRRRVREAEYARLCVANGQSHAPDTTRGRTVIEQALAREHNLAVRGAIRAWLEGERDVRPWLRIPEVTALPPSQQRADVARRKDKFTALVKRLGRRLRSKNKCDA